VHHQGVVDDKAGPRRRLARGGHERVGTIAVLVDTQAPKHSTAGDPYFIAPAVEAISDGPRTQWVTTLAPLHADTTYHIVVAAEDSGGVSYRTGTFRTPRVASGFANQVPGARLGQPGHGFPVARSQRGHRQRARPAADPGAGAGARQQPARPVHCRHRDLPTTSGREMIPNCFELEWNTAEGEIDLHQPTGDQALPECYGFGDGIHGDLCIVLRATGEDPVFDVYLTVDFLDG
jgi:hypothetical protein